MDSDNLLQNISDVVQSYPDKPAIYFEDTNFNIHIITYRQLDNQSTLLAQRIRQHGGSLIGLCMNRGPDLIKAMIAILKAGSHYVPLDKTYPINRIKYIVQDTKLSTIITDLNPEDDKILGVLHDKTNIINISEMDNGSNKEINSDNIVSKTHGPWDRNNVPNDLAYITYTSGSTGRPKGVMIRKSSLHNLIMSAIRILKIKSESNIFQYTSIGFDAAGWDIYIGLLSGSTIHIANDRLAISPNLCHKYMKENKINILTTTPAFLAQMPREHIESIYELIVMGDKSNADVMNFWYSSPNCRIYNGYGPTETTIGATIHEYKPGDDYNNIGKPFDNYYVYVLDRELNMVEKGKVGEMYIGGLGVAKGYLNMPELTNEKFIETKYGRVYRTGDFAKINEDGDIIFIGRVDNQVKINGVRIEMEEIEKLVTAIPRISQKEAKLPREVPSQVCVVYNKDTKLLVLYYTGIGKTVELEEEIKNVLNDNLHRAVVPKRFVRMDRFNLNHNGKIDKTTLPNPVINDDILISPTSNIEKVVVDAYKFATSCDNVGLNTNFFELGGDSLKIQYIAEYLQKYSMYVDPLNVYKYPKISNLINYVLIVSEVPEIITDKGEVHLTPAQLNLWYYQKMYPNDASYNTYNIYRLRNVNIEKLKDSLQDVVDNNDSLRVVISMKNNIPTQICDRYKLELDVTDVEKDNLQDQVNQLISTPFEIEGTLLLRIYLLRIIESNEYILIMVKHNIITDVYSEKLIIRELQNSYNNCNTDRNRKSSFESYIHETSRLYNNKSIHKYWANILADYNSTEFPRSRKGRENTIYKEETFDGIEAFCKSNGITIYNVMLCALNIGLWQYTGLTDITVGTQFADRSNPKWSQTTGFMVQTLLARTKFNSQIIVKEMIESISKNFIDMMENRYVTFDKLVQITESDIDIMFVMQNTGDHSALKLNNVDVTHLRYNEEKSPFPIYIDVYPHNIDKDKYTIRIRHTNKYDPDLIRKFADSLSSIVFDIMKGYNNPISTIYYPGNVNIISGDIKQLQPQTIDQAVSIYQNSDRTAICYSTETHNYLNAKLNYVGLIAKSNQIARYLIDVHNVNKGDIIAVTMNRSPEFVIILLAILKIGACYVPIDSSYPEDRIQYMINDCRPIMVVEMKQSFFVSMGPHKTSRRGNTNNPIEMSTKTIKYTNIEKCSLEYSTDHLSQSDPNDVAYIIYTSGSTGNPKGVMIQHHSVMNTLTYFRDLLKINESMSMWNLTTISFDIMVLEVFLPLTSGSQLMICPHCVSRNPVQLVDWINRHKPDVLQATPTQYSLIGNHINPNNDMTILVGGEPLTPDIAETLLKVTNKLYNVYGPSETTIWSTCKKIESENEINIGKPICNTTCIIINNTMKHAPKGCIGELCIGGMGIGQGYINRNKLTESQFITYESARYYRTGDLVRLNDKNEIEYIGRNDHQVKIRGHRIELNEIACTMEKHPSVKKAIINVNYKDNKPLLVAYYTGEKNNEILEYVRSQLPGYMCPNYAIYLLRFPHTLNGKIDIDKLPNISDGSGNIDYQGEYIPPRNDIEQQIHDLFSSIIDCNKISVTESVLNLGVTSIWFPIFVEKISNKFNKQITIEQFIKNSTISLCAKLINT